MNDYDVLTGHINNIGPACPQRYIANTPNGMIAATVFKAGAMLIANVMAPGGTTTATVRQFGNTTLFDIF